jgi:hypothetical protein
MEIRPPVEIDAITGPEDRFRCKPYGAVLFSRSCGERQRMLTLPRDQRTGDYSFCVDCPDGPRVAAQLGLIAPEALLAKAKNSMMKGNKRKRRKAQPKDERISPSDASRAAAEVAATAPLPQAPPGRHRVRAADPAPKRPEPPDPFVGELLAIEVNLVDLEKETKLLLRRVRSARARLAARP